MIIPEPDITKQRKPEEESFFDDFTPTDNLQNNNPVTVSPGTQKRTSDDIMKEIFSYKPPQPTYDKNRPEELKRLAKTSAIGKGLNVLGDVIGLGTGANVQRRQPDNRELGYLQNLYKYTDDYNRRMDDWNWRDYMSRLRSGEMALSQANREEDRTLRNKAFEADQAWKALGFKSEQAWKNWQMQNDVEDRKLQREKFDTDKSYKEMTAKERERHNKQMEAASMIRAQKTGASSTSKQFTVYNQTGTPIQLGENEREKIMSLILSDPNTKLTDQEMDLLSPSMGEPISTNTMNMLVQKYWEKIPSARDYIYQKYGQTQEQSQGFQTPAMWQAPQSGRPEYQGPVRPGASDTPIIPQSQQPTQQPTQQPAQTEQPSIFQDSAAIQQKYNQLGVDITQDSSYNNALKIAIQQGIVDPNGNPTSEQLQQINEIAKQIEQDKEVLRASKVVEGVGYNTPQQTQQELPPLFQ